MIHLDEIVVSKATEGVVHLHELEIVVEELKDGGDYTFVATSPDLPNLIVAGDPAEEVLEVVPRVAQALIASISASGDELPSSLRRVSGPPLSTHVMIAA